MKTCSVAELGSNNYLKLSVEDSSTVNSEAREKEYSFSSDERDRTTSGGERGTF